MTITDLTSFSKFMMEGADAERACSDCAPMMSPCRPGTTVYTGLLNARGTYESDLTIARLATDRFLLVTGTAQTTRDADWIRRNSRRCQRELTDVTSAESPCLP